MFIPTYQHLVDNSGFLMITY